MEKIMIDERTGWEYELIGEQYYPTGRVMRDGRLQPEMVDADDKPKKDHGSKKEIIIGVWAQRHLRYIKQYKKNLYFDLYVSGRLNEYLAEIEAQVEEMFFRLVTEMAAREGVTEELKAKDQILWVQRNNTIYVRASEIVNTYLIFS
ncbi:MAG: TnpV protein [Clostridia bacterium]|nr:TnpV protein [Clostridia bacterium]